MSHDFASATRRGFLKTAAATVFAAPGFVPATALGRATKASANERIGIGFIGNGRRAGQLTGLPRDGHIVAVADCDGQRSAAWGKKFACPAYQNYHQLLENKDVDAVVVATPDHWHVLASIHACQAGKDVYVEKPMSLTIREGRQLVNAARKYQRVVQVGSQQRSMAANRLGCQLVRDGAIGKVHTVLAHNYPSPWECDLPGQPVPKGLDWDMWCGQTPVVPFNKDIRIPRANPGWISFRPWSGGEMTGWGAHGFDQIQSALGADSTGPVEIWTEGPRFAPPTYTQPTPRTPGDKQCAQPTVFMRYASGVVVKLADGPPGGGKFIGEKGTITIHRGKITSDPPEIVADAKKTIGYRAGGDTREHQANWLACIKSRARSVADVEIGHRSTSVCHLGNIARWAGRRLQWDPQAEQFVGDADANQWVSRPQRKPYQIPDLE